MEELEQPIAPTEVVKNVDRSDFVWPAEEVDQDHLAALEDTALIQCHGGFKSRTGLDCFACDFFEGLIRYGKSGDATQDYRGSCLASAERPFLKARTVAAVSCPEAAAKVEGAKRWDRINAKHCTTCYWNADINDERSLCNAPRGIRYVQLCVG